MSEPVALFLTINGMQVSGESVQQSLGRAQSIECVHYHQVVEIPVQTGSGKATARRQYGPLLIRKRIDKASPLIARALIQQSVVDAVFKFFRTLPDGTSEQFYATHISHARVASLGQYVPDVLDPQTASEPPLEEVTFVFEAIEWTHTSTGVTYQDGGATHPDDWSLTNGSAAAATAPSAGAAGAGGAADSKGGALGSAAGAESKGGAAAGAAPSAGAAGAADSKGFVAAGGAPSASAAGAGESKTWTTFPSRVATVVPLTANEQAPQAGSGLTRYRANGVPSPSALSSPDGKFSVSVADTGVTITGPSGSIKLQPDGSIKVAAATSFDVVAGTSFAAKAGTSANVDAGTSLGLKASGTAALQAAGALTLKGSVINEN